MSAEQMRESADEVCAMATQVFGGDWSDTKPGVLRAVRALRSLADALERGPKALCYIPRAIADSESTVVGQLSVGEVDERPFDVWDGDLWECCPLYDPAALLAAELRERERIGRLREELAAAYIKLSGKERHASSCATSRAPAADTGPCDCGGGNA